MSGEWKPGDLLLALDPNGEGLDMVRARLLDAADRMDNPQHRGNQHRWPDHAQMFRNLANLFTPTPPKPDEPMGLGAVIEDASGCWWVHFTAKTGDWWRNHQGENRRWSEIAAVRVLSEGVSDD